MPTEIPLALPTHLPDVPLYIGHTPAMRRVAEHILALAQTARTSALILGASGTGKELVAGAIHRHSNRAANPFIALNCAAIPPKLAEAELFGSEPGGYTDARMRRGWVEQADTGTLFLDEIGELPLSLQPTLLRFLQTQRFRRLGGERERQSDVRIIAATLRDLAVAVASGAFREDLLYRLNVFVITLPTLRERLDDLPELVAACLRQCVATLGFSHQPAITPDALALLAGYAWPGNLRELRNVLERALILNRGEDIRPKHLPEALRHPAGPVPVATPSLAECIAALALPPEGAPLLDLVHALEARLISQAMAQAGENQSQAARLLSLTRDQLRQRLKRMR